LGGKKIFWERDPRQGPLLGKTDKNQTSGARNRPKSSTSREGLKESVGNQIAKERAPVKNLEEPGTQTELGVSKQGASPIRRIETLKTDQVGWARMEKEKCFRHLLEPGKNSLKEKRRGKYNLEYGFHQGVN